MKYLSSPQHRLRYFAALGTALLALIVVIIPSSATVLAQQGRDTTPRPRVIQMSNQWAVQLAPGADADAIAAQSGFVNAGLVGDGVYLFVAKGDNAGAVKHFMQNGIQVPWFVLLMMQMFGMFRKMAPVGPSLPYDVAFVSPFWNYKHIPANRWPNATMPILTIGGSKSDAWMQNAQKAIAANLPNAEHKTLVGQNHMVAANAIGPMIKEFFG